MKIDMPATLTATAEVDHERTSACVPAPLHEVVVRFGDVQVVRVPFTPEQEDRVDYYAQYNDLVLQDIANETVANVLAKMWVT